MTQLNEKEKQLVTLISEECSSHGINYTPYVHY